ncbi:dTDP-4-dehydrorhamnose 3,5-epimerase [Clostridium hydrogenum]|uniref:dTDP-4-dehydrorhamnose 3,5-epimerase n=1 Tax=Clostridium hydrogenum TaxID=2855764 RepID=UPI001F388022|nr:dTDP-4-dehydrorhamnose 3,5-epimerase [Clostridium hydrogenum]
MKIIKESKLAGCFLIEPNIFKDDRGTLVKPYHSETFKELGLHDEFNEEIIVTSKKNVIRGLHFQCPPLPQIKVVSCVNGEILDVVVDIRKGSPTYGEWEGFVLNNINNYALYVPEGLAHGYAVLKDNTVVCYKMSNIFSADLDGGIRWNSLDIDWKISNPIISEKDKNQMSIDELDSKFIFKHE